jgi:hypothetical protein
MSAGFGLDVEGGDEHNRGRGGGGLATEMSLASSTRAAGSAPRQPLLQARPTSPVLPRPAEGSGSKLGAGFGLNEVVPKSRSASASPKRPVGGGFGLDKEVSAAGGVGGGAGGAQQTPVAATSLVGTGSGGGVRARMGSVGDSGTSSGGGGSFGLAAEEAAASGDARQPHRMGSPAAGKVPGGFGLSAELGHTASGIPVHEPPAASQQHRHPPSPAGGTGGKPRPGPPPASSFQYDGRGGRYGLAAEEGSEVLRHRTVEGAAQGGSASKQLGTAVRSKLPPQLQVGGCWNGSIAYSACVLPGHTSSALLCHTTTFGRMPQQL